VFTFPLFLKSKASWAFSHDDSVQAYTDEVWRSLLFFNLYRIVISGMLVFVTWMLYYVNFGSRDYDLFVHAALSQFILSCLSVGLIRLRYPSYNWQLALQIGIDIILICFMIYASGGIQSGLGILLLVSLTCASLISQGRLAIFFASLAALGILLQETYAFLYVDSYQPQYMQAGFQSMGYIAVAWLAHHLATRAVVNEKLAIKRGADLVNMAQINQLVIEDLQEGILVVDSDNCIRHYNAYAESLLGSKFDNDGTDEVLLARYLPSLMERLQLWRNDSSIDFDFMQLPSHVLVRTRFVQVGAADQAVVAIFLEDMSHVQAQVQQLKLAALGRLTASIAHEIRNPLSAINHAAELLEEEQSLDPAHARLLQIICDNTQRVNKIVQDILQLNRRDIAETKSISLEKFVPKFVDDFCLIEKAERNCFALQFNEPDLIKFDVEHLNQILWNLCRNAWRHCQKESNSVKIIVSPYVNNHIRLDVIDDGPGVQSSQQIRLFEPFFTTVSTGTGLGLYIAREICEANQSSLEYVETESGAQFSILFKGISSHA